VVDVREAVDVRLPVLVAADGVLESEPLSEPPLKPTR